MHLCICMKLYITLLLQTLLLALFRNNAVFSEHSFLPSKSTSSLETVCTQVLLTSSVWGTQVARFVPTCHEKLRGLGPKVLEVASLSSNFSDIGTQTCYDAVIPPLCNIQFEKHISKPGCPDTKEIFFDILSTCLKTSQLGASTAHCPAVNRQTQMIVNPELFCAEAAIREDGPEDPQTGLPSSFVMKTFSNSQQQDCEQNAMTYNACRRVGVKYLGYNLDYCLGGGFSAYCSHAVAVAKDEAFRLACENIVVPALVEYSVMHRGRLYNSDVCKNIYPKMLTYLAARKGQAFLKTRAALHSLQSTTRPVLYTNELKLPSLKSQGVDANFIQLFQPIKNILISVDPYQNSTFPSTIRYQFDIAAEAVNRTVLYSKKLNLPPALPDGTIAFSDVHVVNGALETLMALQKLATQSILTLYNTLQQYSSHALPIFPHDSFTKIEKQRWDTMENEITETVQRATRFRIEFNRLLNIWPNMHTTQNQALINEGVRQVRLSSLRDAQIRLLISINSKENAADIIKNAMT